MSRVRFSNRVSPSLFHRTRPFHHTNTHFRFSPFFQPIRFASTDTSIATSTTATTDLAPPTIADDESLLGEVFELSEQGLSALVTQAEVVIMDDKFTYYTVEDFWLAKFLPIRTFHTCFDILHDYMPWWGIAMFLPWLMKVCLTIPLAVRAQKKQERIMNQLPDALKEMQKFYGKLKASDPDRQEKAGKIATYIKEKYGFNPLTASLKPAMTNLVQAPVHLTMFMAIRTMYPEFPTWKTDGGLLWFKDLSIPDETWGLPLLSGLCMIGNGRVVHWMGDKTGQDTTAQGYFIMAAGIPTFFLGIYYFSSGFSLYTMSNIASFGVQNYLMHNDKFRNVVGLKPTSFQAEYQRQMTKVRADLKKMDDDSKKTELVSDRRQRRKIA